MASDFRICEKCDFAYKGNVCLNCGFVIQPEEANVEKKEDSNFGFLASAIAEAAPSFKVDTPIIKARRFRAVFPAILGIVFFCIGLISYWRFIYFTPEYVSPFVLSKHDVRLPGVVTDEVSEVSDAREKTVSLEVDLLQGNFDQHDFAQFAPSGTTLFLTAFNVKDVLDKFFNNRDILKNIKSEFDLSDNDIDVFFSSGFSIYYPDSNFDKWGFAIFTADKSFADSKVDDLNKKKDSKKFVFKDFYADVVELKSEEADSKYFLLVSNSKEYLDEMKESSEGNVTNLALDIKYTTVKSELPKLGQVFVYHKQDTSLWNLFSEWIATKYDYVGLDKILIAIDAPGIVIFSNSQKLKITTADVM